MGLLNLLIERLAQSFTAKIILAVLVLLAVGDFSLEDTLVFINLDTDIAFSTQLPK